MSQQRETSGRRVELSAHATVITGSRHGTVTALQATTGAVLWRWVPGPRLGTLAHGGEIVYVPTDSPFGARRYLDGPPPRTPEEARNREVAVGHPVTLSALRARDGAVVWQKEGWRASSARTRLILDGDLLIADAPNPEIGQAWVSACDERTGETRWTYDTGIQWGSSERLIAARAGRVFVCEGGFGLHNPHLLHVLDARTGAVRWSRKQAEHSLLLSEGGKLLIMYARGADGTQERVVLNAEDGALVATFPWHTLVHALTDDGIAYITKVFDVQPALVAVRISDGAELWRADGVEAGHLLVTDEVLYYARLVSPGPLAEAGALDAHMGRRLWRWRSPAHLVPLLKLWGRRTPLMIAHALNQGRRSMARARQQHERGIFVREILRGQWRRPGALVSNVHVAAGWGALYVATSLGLFALSADDGRLLWHALPTYDLGMVVPVVSPEQQRV